MPAGKAGVADAILRNSYYVEEENADPETEVLETPEKTVEISFTISGVDEPIHVDGAALTMRSHGMAS